MVVLIFVTNCKLQFFLSFLCAYMPLLKLIKNIFKAMESQIKKTLLSAKLKKNHIRNKVKLEQSPAATVSQYFSPRRTRNQRKIEYENDTKQDVKIKEKTENNKPFLYNNMREDNDEKQEKITGTKRKLYTPEHMLIEKQKAIKTTKNKKIETKLNKSKPTNWQEILENIRQMRSDQLAPVDTMGCDKCADEMLDDKTKRYHILVALMLSSQTKDQTTYEAMNRLKDHSLTPQSIVEIKIEDLENLLCPVSFYKTKAKSLQKTASILMEKYNSDIPNTLDDLIKLPGVGPKMAHICMKSAWNIITGIGVDVHVHRISNRLGWVRNTNNPEQTRIQLESWLPEKYWCEINHLLVGFGQTICTPLKPNCADCKNQNICPSAFKAEAKIKSDKKTK